MIKLVIFDLDGTLYDSDALAGKFTHDFIEPYPGVRDVLEKLNERSVALALVTRGMIDIQFSKIKKLEIGSYFALIEVCDTAYGKAAHFVKILEMFDLKNAPQTVLVVGNRIDEEIRFANMLGCRTMHIKRGKYQHTEATSEDEVPNYVITDYSQFMEVFERIS